MKRIPSFLIRNLNCFPKIYAQHPQLMNIEHRFKNKGALDNQILMKSLLATWEKYEDILRMELTGNPMNSILPE